MSYQFADPVKLQQITQLQKRGISVGIPSICSAHPFVLEACLQQALKEDHLLLVETTCSQVNQFGGDTGLTPAAFSRDLRNLAAQTHFPLERLLLGGDHLGPYPWRKEPSPNAMEKSSALVHDYVSAGYRKIHLDTSISCADDPPYGIPKLTAAQRAANLCAVSEKAASNHPDSPKPIYVIGSEVPVPGGSTEPMDSIHITLPSDAAETLEIFEQEFKRIGLESAWERVIALVVHPGVEFDNQQVIQYERTKTADLVNYIRTNPNFIFEAHSTDYQLPDALRQMIEDQFAILKVGPALTFAFRETVLMLELIEQIWLGKRNGITLSGLKNSIQSAMLQDHRFWADYYRDSPFDIEFAQLYSYSDRIRYYWSVPEVQSALKCLLLNLRKYPPPLTLISQYPPRQYDRIRQGFLSLDPQDWIWDGIQVVLQTYTTACQVKAD